MVGDQSGNPNAAPELVRSSAPIEVIPNEVVALAGAAPALAMGAAPPDAGFVDSLLSRTANPPASTQPSGVPMNLSGEKAPAMPDPAFLSRLQGHSAGGSVAASPDPEFIKSLRSPRAATGAPPPLDLYGAPAFRAPRSNGFGGNFTNLDGSTEVSPGNGFGTPMKGLSGPRSTAPTAPDPDFLMGLLHRQNPRSPQITSMVADYFRDKQLAQQRSDQFQQTRSDENRHFDVGQENLQQSRADNLDARRESIAAANARSEAGITAKDERQRVALAAKAGEKQHKDALEQSKLADAHTIAQAMVQRGEMSQADYDSIKGISNADMMTKQLEERRKLFHETNPSGPQYATDPITGRRFAYGPHLQPSGSTQEAGLTPAQAANELSRAREYLGKLPIGATEEEKNSLRAEIEHLRGIAYPNLKTPTTASTPKTGSILTNNLKRLSGAK
jgi:hypothetical protein